MTELESSIEKKLIDQLCYGDSQWNYRNDLKTEIDLWNNFRHILEQNNKAKLNDKPLSDKEFEQVKNQISFSSFYNAGKWLVGENGLVQVHVQRGNETLHLTVLNQSHISGGTSVYEVINQYQALKEDDEDNISSRDRRFDVTLLINGIPLIHIELKNREHSYMDGFRQIKKYIAEGKFRGIFSSVQMFVVSNAVNTRYFSAARDTELNPKFMSCWIDKDNKPVSGYLDFARTVLKIPEAHEMISKYTVLDNDAKKLLLLRPYQIHAIEAMRNASKEGKSGYIWHTTGSGKTMTSYKATRNLLADIPSIEKTIFLIDRKDLDNQTKMAFQSYANNDTVDVDETDNVADLINKLGNNDRQMIVTTIQKMQIMIGRKLSENHPKYKKIKSLRIAFVVDECHRTISPKTKREFEHFFTDSLWYGFTGTPRFNANPYPQLGDLPRTTGQLFGNKNRKENDHNISDNVIKDEKPLHKYTIKDAVHDDAVLGFMIEYLDSVKSDQEQSDYDSEQHMLTVLNTILNKSNVKFGIENGKGLTYEAILTTTSIEKAQKYYDLLKKIKNGEVYISNNNREKQKFEINEDIKKILPDFPKFAITYSVTENDESSLVNQNKMKESLDDYNKMFDTHYDLDQITSYNANLNDRLARKIDKFKTRNQQLDLVIVVNRLLTGFDAPCLSTLFVDRPPMHPHDIIQALSRTNRIFDKNKKYGQVVTFQYSKQFKKDVDEALKLFSSGSIGDALAADWDKTEKEFIGALATLRAIAPTPNKIPEFSKSDKIRYLGIYQKFDTALFKLRSFTKFEAEKLEKYKITQEECDDYAAHYLNIIEEFKQVGPGPGPSPEPPGSPEGGDIEIVIDTDYEPKLYMKETIDYEYIIRLIQNIVSATEEDDNEEEFKIQIEEVRKYIAEFSAKNEKLGSLMKQILDGIEQDKKSYTGCNISEILISMKRDVIANIVDNFVSKWCVNRKDVLYAIDHNKNGTIPNQNNLKDSLNYQEYKESTEIPLTKLKARAKMLDELQQIIDKEVTPLHVGVHC